MKWRFLVSSLESVVAYRLPNPPSDGRSLTGSAAFSRVLNAKNVRHKNVWLLGHQFGVIDVSLRGGKVGVFHQPL